MATKTAIFPGTIAWAKLFKPDEFRGNRFWVVDFYPDLSVLKEFQALGLQAGAIKKPLMKDGVGFKLRRPVMRVINGKNVEFDPPFIRMNGQPFSQSIGNGTKANVTLVVYDKGYRLQGIDITELVVYERPDNDAVAKVTTTKGW